MVEAKLTWTGAMRFAGVSEFGHEIAIDGSRKAGGDEDGYKPTELVLYGLAGCTGIDVVKILDKMRQEVTGVEIDVKGFQPDQFPKPFNRIEIKYTFRGHNLDEEKVKKAIELSEEKYCAVSLTLRGIARITSEYEIIEETENG